MVRINLKPPKIERNKIFLSWEPNFLFKDSGYWIEYLNLDEINASPQALLEAYLPVCLTFCALGDVEINFPYHFNNLVLDSWEKIFKDTAQKLFKRRLNIKFLNPLAECGLPAFGGGAETALLFGGGAESLLSLANLLDKNIYPYLISIWGSNWLGSDLAVNKDRLVLEENIATKLNLRFIRIWTNFREMIDPKAFHPYLRLRGNIMNSALFLPLNLSLLIPIASFLHIGKLVSGNEKESSEDPFYYSLGSEMTANLKSASSQFEYLSMLEDLRKVDVIRELHQRYPHIGKYQYSCWKSINQRWCLLCEKCFRNYTIFKIYGILPSLVGMDENILLANLTDLLSKTRWGVASSQAECREWRSIQSEAKRLHKEETISITRDIFRKYYLRRQYLIFQSLLENIYSFYPMHKLFSLFLLKRI